MARCGGGEGEVNLPLSSEEDGFERKFHTPLPVSKETVRRIESASRTPPHSCCEEFCLTEAVFERIGFEVSLRSFLANAKININIFPKLNLYLMKIGSGRGPGSTPGDPKKRGGTENSVPLSDVGGRGASQGRFWSDFELILGSLFEHFRVQCGS